MCNNGSVLDAIFMYGYHHIIYYMNCRKCVAQLHRSCYCAFWKFFLNGIGLYADGI